MLEVWLNCQSASVADGSDNSSPDTLFVAASSQSKKMRVAPFSFSGIKIEHEEKEKDSLRPEDDLNWTKKSKLWLERQHFHSQSDVRLRRRLSDTLGLTARSEKIILHFLHSCGTIRP
jgi:hypothetical protein